MDAHRRAAVAAHGAAMLEELQTAVVESWQDLLPAASRWGTDSAARARAASRAALAALVELFGQGDLDDRTWDAAREVVYGGGHANRDEVEELLRTVRIVGVELLADRLADDLDLTHDERWQLQLEAATFCEALLGEREELDAGAYERLLTELERSGGDIR